MPEILTESFCERCGTRYTFESSAPKTRRFGKLKVLGKGVVNFVSNDDTSLDEAFADARSDQMREATNQQLDAFHKTFQFCMSCRQYTCANCWNEPEGHCLSCAPLADAFQGASAQLADLGPPMWLPAAEAADGLPANGHDQQPVSEAMAWPTTDLPGEPPKAPADEPLIGAPDSETTETAAFAAEESAHPGLGAAAVGAAGAAHVAVDGEPEIAEAKLGEDEIDDDVAMAVADAERARSEAHRAKAAAAAAAAAAARAPEVHEGQAAAASAATSDLFARFRPPPEAAPPPAEAPELAAAAATPVEPRTTTTQDDRIETPTWSVVAPDAEPASEEAAATTPAAPTAPAWPTPETTPPPQWPMPSVGGPPQWPAPIIAPSQSGADLWAASSRDVLSQPGSGIQACVSCGLSLSASARFCRRCGSQQH